MEESRVALWVDDGAFALGLSHAVVASSLEPNGSGIHKWCSVMRSSAIPNMRSSICRQDKQIFQMLHTLSHTPPGVPPFVGRHESDIQLTLQSQKTVNSRGHCFQVVFFVVAYAQESG